MLVDHVLGLSDLRSLFPPGSDVTKIYRDLIKQLHPDVNNDPRAPAAFIRLSEYYKYITGSPVKTGIKDSVITKIINWDTIGEPIVGDVTTIYTTTDNKIIKLVNSGSDNDLMDLQKSNLMAVITNPLFEKNKWVLHYIPKVLGYGTFGGKNFHLMEDYRIGYFTLEELIKRNCLTDFRHIVWIVNRVLTLLHYSHSVGLVHGAVVPNHILIDNVNHGAKLIDWTASAAPGKTPYVSNKYRHFYPKEVVRKKSDFSTDIFMLMSIFRENRLAPSQFRPVFDWAVAGSPSSRPTAAELLKIWKNTAEKVYGPPKFVKLEIDSN